MTRMALAVVSTVVGAVRTVALGLAVVVATVLLGSYVLVAARVNPRSRTITWAMRTWAHVFVWLGGMRVTLEGLDHLDPERSYVLVSNHLSNMDPPFHIAKVPVSIRFLAKKELFRIPLFGPAMRAIGIVETDRQAHASAHRDINRGVDRAIDLGASLIVYPEGTRSRDGELHPFKKGAFRIAVDHGLPVVPVAIRGTREVWPPGSMFIRGGPVAMVFHEPIPTAGLDRDDIEGVRDRAHAAIAATLERLDGEAGPG